MFSILHTWGMPFNDMLKEQKNKEIDPAQDGFLKDISISCVILCFDCGTLKTLLLKASDQLTLLKQVIR
jgi:hypothetical protein